MRTGKWFVFALAFCLLMGTFSMANADYTDEKTWFLGANFGYWTVNPFLDQIYEERGSITGSPFGIQGGYAWEINDTANVEVVGTMEYWAINMTDDNYMVNNGDPEDLTSVRTDGNVSMFSLGCMARFPLKVHPIVQPLFAIGLDLGFLSGDIEKRDHGVTNTGIIIPEEWEKASKPGVIPIVDLLTGVRFHIPDNVNIDINLGIRSGLYAGMGIVYVY